MPNPINDNRFPLNLKQNPEVPNTQAILRGKICEPLDISLQITAHLLNSRKDAGLNPGRQTFNVFYCPWFESNVISHRFSAFDPPCLILANIKFYAATVFSGIVSERIG
jgi:hypothetical protein